jgi:hypothetical protein
MEPADFNIRRFEFDPSSVRNVEDVVDFLSSMGLKVVLVGGTTFEQLGQNPRFWKEIDDSLTIREFERAAAANI